MIDLRRATLGLAAGTGITILGVTALARSYPWEGGYSFAAWVAAPVPILLDDIFTPTVWLLNVIAWTVALCLSPPTWRWIVGIWKAARERWSNPGFRKTRRVLVAASLAGLFMGIEYVAVSNTQFWPNAADDTGAWRYRSLIPVWKAPWRDMLEIVRPILVQPLATPVRFAFNHFYRFRGTVVARWLTSSQGLAEGTQGQQVFAPGGGLSAERKWDWQFTAINAAIWVLLAFGLLQVLHGRFPALSSSRYLGFVMATVVAFGCAHYGWFNRYRWSGIVAARWDVRRGTLAFYSNVPSSGDTLVMTRISYSRSLLRNLCGVEIRHQGIGRRAAEFTGGYNSVMEAAVKRRLGQEGFGRCLDRATSMMWKRYPLQR
jgi:hypothetical protein